jgi:pimeloyl-ACP methyl ester carboxylesterase
VAFPSSPPPLPGVVHTDVRVERHRWHVATAGEDGNPPVVLLHGWPQHWWIWRRVIEDLARTHRVYAPDLRGFGWSDAPEGRYSKMGLAADVEQLLDELGIGSCTLAGHDWGGFTAFLTAIRAPERVERLAVFSIIHPWLRGAGRDPKALASTLYQPVIGAPVLGPRIVRRGTPLLRLMLRRGAGPGFTWDPQDVRLYAEQWQRPDHARATSALYRTFLVKELPALLRGRYANRRLEMPITLVTGEHDPVVTPDRLAGYEGHAPQMRTETIAGAGHFLPDEKPGEVIRVIRELMQR